MKLNIDAILQPQPDFVGWHVTPTPASVTLNVTVGGKRVRIEFSPEEAKEVGCAGIHAAYAAAGFREQAQAQRVASIIAPSGNGNA